MNALATPTLPRETTVLQIPLELIDVGANVRVNVAEIDELAASIAEHGVLQPIKVRDADGDRYLVTWGQRRVLAARKAGLERIPALVGDSPEPDQLAIEQLVENLHRADLNPIDRAQAMRTVIATGMTQAALARKLGIGASTVANDVGLLDAPAKVQSALESGAISPAHAKAVKGLPSAEQVRLVDQAVRYGKSAHELENDAKYARQEVARQERDRARLEKIGASAVAQLDKAVAKDALVVVSGAIVANAVKKAGWTNLWTGDRWAVDVVKKAGECGCATWFVDYDTYGGKAEAKLKPACADKEHRDARKKAGDDERTREWNARQAEAKAYEKSRAEQMARLMRRVAADVAGLSVNVQRALLLLLADDYHASEGLRTRHGGSPNGWQRGEIWKLIEKLSERDVAKELGIAIAEGLVPAQTWQAETTEGARALLLRTDVEEAKAS